MTSNRYGILRKLVYSYSFHQKAEDMENLDGSPSLSTFSVCLSVLRFYEKPLRTLETLEKFYPQE